MKTIIIISVGTVISALVIIQILFLLFAAKPELFTAVQKIPAADSVNQKISMDTLSTPTVHASSDSLSMSKTADRKLSEPVAKNEIKNSSEKKVVPVTAVPAADSVNVKTQAQMLEAMGIDGAAKIMSTMNDKEVKAILPKLKKRTAAKILVSFDPNRAARLLR